MAKSKSQAKREAVQEEARRAPKLKEGDVAAQWVPIESIHPWPKNPRKPTDERINRIARSIDKYGWGRAITARAENGEIVAGEGAWRAAKKRGDTLVPVRFIEITEKHAHELAIADNRHTELTEWDGDLLLEQLNELSPAEKEIIGWEIGDLEPVVPKSAADAEFKEYGEDAADDVEYIKCPHCGERFPAPR